MAQAVLSGAPEAEMQALGRDVQTAIAGGFLAQRWLMQQQTIKATADWTKKLLEHLGVPLENVWRNALTPSPSPSASNGRGRPATSRGG
jgi:hypothetical protein